MKNQEVQSMEKSCGTQADRVSASCAWDETGIEAGQFEAFRQIVAALRSEHGCPWDREQTFESLKPCMINEMTEAIAAINIYKEENDPDNLCEELGDVLLQVVLLAQIAEEEGLFRVEDVIRGIGRKMIRRHPHVFHDPEMEEAIRQLQEKNALPVAGKAAEGRKTSSEIPGLWELIKRAERKDCPEKNKDKERAAFGTAAGEVLYYLQQKISGKPQ